MQAKLNLQGGVFVFFLVGTNLLACRHFGVDEGSESLVKVIDGKAVAKTDPAAKSTVYIVMPISDKGTVTCSGTLISQRHVLTAAHCFAGFTDELTRAAEVRFGVGNSSDPFVKVPVLKQVSHPEFHNQGRTGFFNPDIALLTLTQDAPLGFEPAPLLQRTDEIAVHERLLIAGYGVNSEGPGGTSGVLLQGTMHVTSVRPYAPEIHLDKLVGDSMSCHGDSGGSLYKMQNGKLYLAGVTSAGAGSYCEGSQAIYTDVRYLTDWVARAQVGQDLSARSDVPNKIGPDGKSYPYCHGASSRSEITTQTNESGITEACIVPNTTPVEDDQLWPNG